MKQTLHSRAETEKTQVQGDFTEMPINQSWKPYYIKPSNDPSH